jgi:hypothetical protein
MNGDIEIFVDDEMDEREWLGTILKNDVFEF